MPSLHELQRAVARQLLAGSEPDLDGWVAGGGFTPEERLDIHRGTVLATLTRALRLSFPAVHRIVGAEFFEGAARVFLHAHPPASGDLDAWGAAFPGFLRDFGHAAALGYLPDVASLEWMVTRALHAPEAGPIDVAALAALAPADHERVRFQVHPAVSLLRSPFPVDAIWRAVLARDDEGMAAVDLGQGPVHLLVERSGGTVEVQRLAPAEWEFAAALFAGQPLGRAQVDAPHVDVPAALASHLAAGRLAGFTLASPEETP